VTATREPSGGLARQELFITRVIATRVIHYANYSGVQPELFSVNALTSGKAGYFVSGRLKFYCLGSWVTTTCSVLCVPTVIRLEDGNTVFIRNTENYLSDLLLTYLFTYLLTHLLNYLLTYLLTCLLN